MSASSGAVAAVGMEQFKPHNLAEVAHFANESLACARSLRSDLLFLTHPDANPRQVLSRIHKTYTTLWHYSQMMKLGAAGPHSMAAVLSSPALALPQDSKPAHVELGERLQRLHRWTRRTHEMTQVAQNELRGVAMLKRSHLSVGTRRTLSRPTPPVHRQTDVLLTFIPLEVRQQYRLEILKRTDNTVVLHALVDNVFYALLLFRGCIIEHVLVRGLDEPINPRNPGASSSSVDLYTPSQYRVFQKVSDYAQVALLHFVSTQFSNVAILSYLKWLNSYSNLFTAKCVSCGRHLVDGLPPVWRDNRKIEPYHEACKP